MASLALKGAYTASAIMPVLCRKRSDHTSETTKLHQHITVLQKEEQWAKIGKRTLRGLTLWKTAIANPGR